ncbi:CAP domain-containing protein [Peribacillus alkalitolerans]|uniref:CAP domain-containing protein n=1 Tax=Peribacillus alkalitolerans TaxID=1550385 RepID=UPI001F081E21|nr:CAP domain-containing protein [Peribacillus alkalitolerans]
MNVGTKENDNELLIQNNEVNKKNSVVKVDPQNDDAEGILEKPDTGVATLIGKPTSELVLEFGKPSRVDYSAYGYNWWIYNQNDLTYLQAAVKDGKVVSVYGLGEQLNVQPFRIGQSVEEIYKTVFVESSVELSTDKSSYRFELSEDDMHMRPLVKIGDIYAVIYLDKFTSQISSIRFIDDETLIKHRPYELIYRGELTEDVVLSDNEWAAVEAGDRKQIFDITNIIRKRHGLNPLLWDDQTAQVAYGHSQEMFTEDYFSHTSPNNGELGDRLAKGDVQFLMAGENIAAHYVDGVAAVSGWLNSKGHRETLLNEEFTHLGVGVYQKYFTQNFIKKME